MPTRPQAATFDTLDFHVPRTPNRVDTSSSSWTSSTNPPPYLSSGQSQPAALPWRPKARKRVPVVSLTTLIVALGCIAACVAILKTSDGQPIESWPTAGAPVQPSVMLSVGAALANMAIRFMFCEGLNITWWRKAIRGTTVGDLHRTWLYGTNFWEILGAGRHFNLIALASLFVSFVAIDGPLLQKASSVVTQSWTETSNITVSLGSNISMIEHPTGFTTGRSATISALSDEFLPAVQHYNNRASIPLNFTGCAGTCDTTLIGPGLDVRCNQTLLPLELNRTVGSTTPVLGFSFRFSGGFDAATMTLNNTLRTTKNPNNLTYNSCSLHLATVAYPVTLSNNTVVLRPKESPNTNETMYLQYLIYETYGLGTWPSTLGGIATIADRKFSSTASLYMNGSPYELDSEGSAVIEYLDPQRSKSPPEFTWLDPTDDMLSAVREIMFRYAVLISSNTTSPSPNSTPSAATQSAQAATATSPPSSLQIVSAETVTQRPVYKSDYKFLGYAILVMGLALVATSINVYGWWDLGRDDFGLGPLEVARAFEAPFLRDAEAEEEFSGKTNLARKHIRYGVLSGAATGSRSLRRERTGSKEKLVGGLGGGEEDDKQEDRIALSERLGSTATEYRSPGGAAEEGRTRLGMGVPAEYR